MALVMTSESTQLHVRMWWVSIVHLKIAISCTLVPSPWLHCTAGLFHLCARGSINVYVPKCTGVSDGIFMRRKI